MHPTRTSTLTLVVAGVVLFVLSYSGQANGFWSSGPSWLGTIGWFGFLICVLLLAVSGLYTLFSRNRTPRSPRT
jgi:protein-S-isoprenylcysteine O-methyltransferase Ste14